MAEGNRLPAKSDEVTYPYWGAQHPEPFEWLNICSDPEQKVERLIESIAPWEGKTVLDIGAGSGFHTNRFAAQADHFFAVEPDPAMRRQMFARFGDEMPGKVSVIAAGAQSIPLADGLIDLAIARFAYFFGTDACLPGLAEVRRLLKPGGHFFVVDVVPEYGTWGALAVAAYPKIFTPDYHAERAAFYARHGFTEHPVKTILRAPDRNVMEQILRHDFPHKVEEFMEQIDDLELDYGLTVYHLQFDD